MKYKINNCIGMMGILISVLESVKVYWAKTYQLPIEPLSQLPQNIRKVWDNVPYRGRVKMKTKMTKFEFGNLINHLKNV